MMASSSRNVHPEERRAVLLALGPAMGSCSLSTMLPKFPAKAGRDASAIYAAPAVVARRGGNPSSCFQTISLKLQVAANVARKRLARTAGGGAAPTLWPEDSVSYGFIINVLSPIGNVIGFDAASTAVLSRLSSGRDQSAALDRLCRLEPPFPEPPAEPPAESPAEQAHGQPCWQPYHPGEVPRRGRRLRR